MSRRCGECGARLSPAARFCRSCGAEAAPEPQRPACESCGTPLVDEARFCHRCGQPAVARGEDATVVLAAKADAEEPAVRQETETLVSRAAAVSPVPARPARLSCAACGAGISPLARFCRSCGAATTGVSPGVPPQAPSVRPCPGCGAQVEAWAAFCRLCGLRLEAPLPPHEAAGKEGGWREDGACAVCGAPAQPGGSMCPQCIQTMPA